MTDAVTQEDSRSALMVEGVQALRVEISEVRFPQSLRCDGDRKQVWKSVNPHWQEKLLGSLKVPVPQTDTGRRGENPKTIGRSIVKELGKMTP